MKKLYIKRYFLCIISLLCISSVIVACNPDGVKKNSKEFGYNFFDKLDWGMPKDTVIKELKLTKEEATVQAEKSGETFECFSINKNVFNHPATIYLYFLNKLDGFDKKVGLYKIDVVYADNIDKFEIKSKLKENILKQNVKLREDVSSDNFPQIPQISFTSDITITKLENTKALEMLKQKITKSSVNCSDMPLSTVVLKQDDKNKSIISYEALPAALLNYGNKYF